MARSPSRGTSSLANCPGAPVRFTLQIMHWCGRGHADIRLVPADQLYRDSPASPVPFSGFEPETSSSWGWRLCRWSRRAWIVLGEIHGDVQDNEYYPFEMRSARECTSFSLRGLP